MKINVYFDGGTRGNRACFVVDDGVSVIEKKIGIIRAPQTNNQLEYIALLGVLRFIKRAKYNIFDILIKGDSQLIIRHLKGGYKVKSKKLIDLNEQARLLIGELGFPIYNLFWVPRSENLAGIELEK